MTLPLTDQSDRCASTRAAVIGWILAGFFLLFCAYPAPVTRTQEARVLETAREMVGQPWRAWMVPHTNGTLRLRKPPLAYWLSAASFSVLGVSAWAGRVPAVVSAWGTLGFTFLIARRLFDARVAWLAAGALLGSFLFMRFMLLAETDTLSAVFITGGIYAVIRCFDATKTFRWQHLMTACMALAILAKGPGAAFVILFLIALCAARREWRPMRQFFTSGAILTLLVIALPWFIYIQLNAPAGQLAEDFRNSAEGGQGHSGSPLKYVPLLMNALLPWTVAALIALYAGVVEAFSFEKSDAASRRRLKIRATPDSASVLTVLIWCGAISIPLAAWGNKQIHYLLPLMPADMILLGWALARAIDCTNARWQQWMRLVLWIIFGLLLLTPLAVVAVSMAKAHGGLHRNDVALIITLAAISCFAIFIARAKQAERVLIGVVLLGIGAMFTATIWAATLSRSTPDDVVKILSVDFPNAQFVFRGPEHLPTCFALRQVVPVMADDNELLVRAKSGPVVCIERGSKEEGVTPIYRFHEVSRIADGDNFYSISIPDAP